MAAFGSRSFPLFRQMPSFASVTAFCVAIVALIGEALSVDTLSSWKPDAIPMFFLPAVCLILLSVSLWLVRRGNPARCSVITASIVTLVAIWKTVGLLQGVTELSYFLWMPLITAVNSGLLGLSILAHHESFPTARFRWISPALAVASILTSLLSLSGFAYGAQFGFGMSLSASISYLLLGLGALMLRPDTWPVSILLSDTAGGVIVRRLIPAAILLPILFGWFRVFGQGRGWFDYVQGVSVLVLLNVITLLFILSWTAWQLHEMELARRQALIALRMSYDELELRVNQRTAELSENQEWLFTVLTSIGDAVVATDAQGRIKFINPVAESLTGWKHQDAIGKDLSSVLHLLDEGTRQKISDPVGQMMQGQLSGGLGKNAILVAKDGSENIVEDSGAPIRNLKGEMIGAVLVFRDSTEKWQSERRRNFLAETTSELVSSLDYSVTLGKVAHSAVPEMADFFIVELIDESRSQPALTALWHRDPLKREYLTQLKRASPRTLVFDIGGSRVIRTGKSEILPQFMNSVTARQLLSPELLQLAKTFDVKSAMIVPLKAHERVSGVMTFYSAESCRQYNVEDLLMAEELGRRAGLAIENARLYQQAQQAIRMRDEFLSIASHELKTPLTPLKILIQNILRLASSNKLHEFPKEKFKQMSETADRQIHRLSNLIEDLLNVSRINIRGLTLHREHLDLRRLVRDVISNYVEQFELEEIPVEIDAPEPVIGHWDRLRVEQVILNLFTNAIKYGRGKRVRVSILKVNEQAELRIQDYGIGIEEKDRQRIFERFERGVSSSHFGGLGLGLYISQQIVNAHGGNITVESEFGKGSVFTVILPLNEEQTAHQATA